MRDDLTKLMGEKLACIHKFVQDMQMMRSEPTTELNRQRLLSKYSLDVVEQYTRRDNVRVTGLNEETEEGLIDKLIYIAQYWC